MKNKVALILSLVALFAASAFAQQGSSSQQPAQTPATQTQQTQQPADVQQGQTATENKDSAAMATGKEPLKYESRQGFWGKVNPFARKKYVQRQVQPVRDRVNELDELTASNTKMINDVDSRAQSGLQQANSRVQEADSHAVDAGNRAQQANQTATQAGQKLDAMNTTVSNLDQYQQATQVEIRFKPGDANLGKNSKDALDSFAQGLKDQKGYIVEVQGFSSGRGSAAVRSSKNMAEAVVRYLVENSEVPVYRIYTIGMGNTPSATAVGTNAEGKTRRTVGGHVEVSLMKNGLADMNKSTISSPSNPGADK